MLPRDLKAEQFAGYPPEARKLVVAHLGAVKQLPLSFVPSLLREVIEYDYKFPAEHAAIDRELAALSSLTPAQIHEWFQAFWQLSLSGKLESLDWINQPAQFVEQLSAYLWTTHQLDAFTDAAIAYGNRTRIGTAPQLNAMRRLGVAVIGQGVLSYDGPLFRNLREHGTYFRQVKSENGVKLLLAAVEARAKTHPVPYGHWYVDGGQAAEHSPLLTCVSFQRLEPVRAALLKNIQMEIGRPGMGPEELRTHMARLSPTDLGLDKGGDEVLQRFQVKLLTEGSGTQIFSTTFAQWTAREALRRAQPLTLFVRFAPRQRQKPMNELMSGGESNPELDLRGSLIDADMGAYYHWINQQRLPGSEQSSFLVWFEDHSEALVIAPSLPRGTESNSMLNLAELLSVAG
ncbi:hypothetical protein [Tunturiibacter gelidoferens]|uniref:Uncharacterized protein n=1 Tax=Tunturiibacter lichenicola TaxID=2051959 RepID=A0A7Y9NLY6_9BACT|nr:hypothetical protein [Edaphobacter lichenicola]NYF51783.1 hypothetical protein [Edaphobacter lichenicola]